MAHDVFISYSHKDSTVAQAVCAKLEQQQIRCWYAPRNIKAGEEWASSIMDALKQAKVMVLIFTDYSNASVQVKREVDNAINAGVTVIPFKLTENNPTGAMEYYLATLHWLDAMDKPLENAIDELTVMVKNVLEGGDPGGSGHWENNRKGGKRITKQAIIKILSCIPLLVVAGFGIAMFCWDPTFHYDVSVIVLGIGLIALFIVINLISGIFLKNKTRKGWLWCLIACIVVIIGIVAVCIPIEMHAPASLQITEKSDEISQNMANYSFAVRDDKGDVYYVDYENGSSGIYRASLSDFKKGKGECLIKNVDADNLTLAGQDKLIYRKGINTLCCYDLNTGRNEVLKKLETSHYYASDEFVIFTLETFTKSINFITLDGKYESNFMNDNSYYLNVYKGDLYFLDENFQFSRMEGIGYSTLLGFSIQNMFIIHDDIVYFYGSSGDGIYRAPLDHLDDMEKLSDSQAYGMVVYKDHLYFINAEDNYSLYSISLEDGNEN